MQQLTEQTSSNRLQLITVTRERDTAVADGEQIRARGAKLETEFKVMKDRLGVAEIEVVKQTETMASLVRQRDIAVHELMEVVDQLKTLQKQVDQLNKAAASPTSPTSSNSTSPSSATLKPSESEKLKRRVSELEEEVEQLRRQTNENETVMDTLAQLQQDNDSLVKQVNELNKLKAELTTSLNRQQTESSALQSSLQSQLVSANRARDVALNDLESLKLELTQLRTQLASLQQEEAEQEKEIVELTAQRDEAINELFEVVKAHETTKANARRITVAIGVTKDDSAHHSAGEVAGAVRGERSNSGNRTNGSNANGSPVNAAARNNNHYNSSTVKFSNSNTTPSASSAFNNVLSTPSQPLALNISNNDERTKQIEHENESLRNRLLTALNEREQATARLQQLEQAQHEAAAPRLADLEQQLQRVKHDLNGALNEQEGLRHQCVLAETEKTALKQKTQQLEETIQRLSAASSSPTLAGSSGGGFSFGSGTRGSGAGEAVSGSFSNNSMSPLAATTTNVSSLFAGSPSPVLLPANATMTAAAAASILSININSPAVAAAQSTNQPSVSRTNSTASPSASGTPRYVPASSFNTPKADRYTMVLSVGTTLNKHIKKGKAADVAIFVSANGILYWTDPKKRKLDPKDSLNLHYVHRLTKTREDDVWKRKEAKQVREDHVLNLYGENNFITAHFEFKESDVRNEWYEALLHFFMSNGLKVST